MVYKQGYKLEGQSVQEYNIRRSSDIDENNLLW